MPKGLRHDRLHRSERSRRRARRACPRDSALTEIEGFVLGVDLGTSHTVAMLRRPDGRTRPLLFDGQPLLPSAVYLDATGRLQVGADAVRLGHAEPGRLEPNPKRRVDDGTVLLGDSANVPVADLFAALLG